MVTITELQPLMDEIGRLQVKGEDAELSDLFPVRQAAARFAMELEAQAAEAPADFALGTPLGRLTAEASQFAFLVDQTMIHGDADAPWLPRRLGEAMRAFLEVHRFLLGQDVGKAFSYGIAPKGPGSAN